MHIISATDAFHSLPESKLLDGSGTLFDIIGDIELWASGRDAIRSEAEALKGFKRIFIPRYICPALPIFFKDFARICFYGDSPFVGKPIFDNGSPGEGDAIVIVNFFGQKNADFWNKWMADNPNVFTIEDHTLDPFGIWANGSLSDMTFASLRKILPIPDGAWLKRRRRKPRKIACKPADSMNEFACQILAGMSLKSLLIHTNDESYRKLFLKGEEKLFKNTSVKRISPWSYEILKKLNIKDLVKNQKTKNTAFYKSEAVKKLPISLILNTDLGPILCFCNAKDCEFTRKALSKPHNRPAVFWPDCEA